MKVLFLIKPPQYPSSRVRIRDIIPFLADNNIETELQIIPALSWLRRKLFQSAGEYDAVVLQKQLIPAGDLAILRKRARKLIYDFDDAVYLKNAGIAETSEKYLNFRHLVKFSKIINSADIVVAANKVLSRKVQEINPGVNCQIVPSGVPVHNFRKEDYAIERQPVIGWTGIKSNLKYLSFIAPALQKLTEKHDFILRIIADKSMKLKGVKIEFRHWHLETQYEEIRQFDIGIMPLSPNPYAEGKSAYKLLQYMSVGVPTVASSVGMNKDLGKDDYYCLLANNVDDFGRKLNLLLNHQQLRQDLGLRGRKLIEERFSLEHVGKAWVEILHSHCR